MAGSLLGTLCITALVATACGSAQGSGSGGSGQTISLYYVASLTGDGDVTGIAGCDGEQLAVPDINAAGGVAKGPLQGAKFKVQCLDDQDSSAQDTSLVPAGGIPLLKPQWPVGARSYRATPYLPTLHHTCHP